MTTREADKPILSAIQKTAALGFFKDWTNYLLITTVAALGWVSSQKHDVLTGWPKAVCVWSFAGSILFAILMLALIPLVAELLRDGKRSIYEVDGRFTWGWWWGSECRARLKYVC